MKKYIISFSLSLITICILLLLTNCAEKEGGPSNMQQQGSNDGSFGFTPGSPIADNTQDSTSPDSGYGFNPDVPRGTAFSSGSSGGNGSGNKDPLYKSGEILELEGRYGTSAPLTITDTSVFEDFRLGVPINSMDDIEDMRVYVKLGKTDNNRYAGQITITYRDHGREKDFRRIQFRSGKGDNARYNVWFKKDNKDYFHGFFQENGGSIVLVVDSVTPVVSNRDNPTPTTLYSGSIWTMQFRTTFQGKNSCNNRDQKYISQYNKETPRSPIPTLASRNKKCWFFTSGPFDCRTWRSGDRVDTFRAVNPDDSCYQKMGTFIGLDILKAFGVSKRSDIAVHNN